MEAVEVVRRHPEWYFRSGRFDVEELVSLVVQEALRGGASSVEVDRFGSWVKVEADVDWLDGDLAAFFAPLSYEEGGRNSSRVEVALTAFCDAVVTVTDAQFEVTSSLDAAQNAEELPPVDAVTGRAILFLPPASARAVVTAERSPTSPTRRPHLTLVQGEGESRIASAIASFLAKVDHG